MKTKSPPNVFVYRKIIKEYIDQPISELEAAVAVVLEELTAQIETDNKAPEREQMERIESVLMALRELINKKEKENRK